MPPSGQSRVAAFIWVVSGWGRLSRGENSLRLTTWEKAANQPNEEDWSLKTGIQVMLRVDECGKTAFREHWPEWRWCGARP